MKIQPYVVICALLLLAANSNEAAPITSPRIESAFVHRISVMLRRLYPTVTVAERAGYVQMRGLDKDNTAIYTNFKYQNVADDRPDFLWFDRSGKLVGVDYEFPTSTWATPPKRFPVARSRWTTIPEHVHFAYTLRGRTLRHGGSALPGFRGQPITLSMLQSAKLVPPHARLLWASYHPTCWDLGFWLVPNPAGPFAAHNVLVK